MRSYSYKPTVSQRLTWFDQAISPDAAKYNIGGYAYLQGSLRLDCFNEAIRQVINTQEVYRTRFTEIDFELQCDVDEPLPAYQIEVIDLSQEVDAENKAIALMAKDFSMAFAVSDHYLFKFILFRVSSDRHLWYAKIHHLVSDGLSFKLLLNQASEIYTSLVAQQEISLPEFRYSDYAIEDEAYYQSTFAREDRAFWMQAFAALPNELLVKKYAAMGRDEMAGSDTLQLSAKTKQVLEEAAKALNVSVFNLVIGLLLLYFSRTRMQDALVLGIPVLNRTKKKYRSTAGVFMNLLAIPFAVDKGDTFSALAKMVKERMSKCLRHQRYQYGNLVKELALSGGKPLYDIRVSYEDFEFTSQFDNLQTGAIALSNHTEIDKLAIYLRDYHQDGFDVRFVFDPAYCSRDDIRSIKASLEKMIAALPGWQEPVGQLALLSDEEQQAIRKLAAGTVRLRGEATFVDLWNNACNVYPDNTCVSTATAKYSYSEMHTMAATVAAALRESNDFRKNNLALLLPRSEKMIAGLLGAMMAGLTYIPLDTDYPAERIQKMLQDAGCNCLLSSRSLPVMETDFAELTIIFLEDILDKGLAYRLEALVLRQEDPCYIIYTSGSTGSPKGVSIAHEAMVDYVCTFREYFDLSAADVVVQQASIGFDTAVEEIFPILSVGGRLHIIEDRKDIYHLATVLEQENVTLLSTSPLVIRMLNHLRMPASLRTLISGGDVLKMSYADNLLQQGISVYNTYGPTESTVCATYYRVTEGDELVPIGTPITNREVFILDNQQQLQPLAVEGEIVLGGKGLAIEYVNSPASTSQKFIPHPFMPGQRVYRTGDSGMMMPDGNIVFKGRKDEQLSFRGYRIEAGEVESIITSKCGIEHCVVVTREYEGVPRLVAYLQSDSAGAALFKSIQETVAAWLPPYMVPEVIVPVPAFHLLSSGKVDKKKLPAITQEHWVGSSREKVLPANELEQSLVKIWSGILPLREISVLDSFFDIGGNSLHAVQLLNLLFKRFTVKLTIRELFEHASIREMATLIGKKAPAEYHVIENVPAAADYIASSGQERLWLLDQTIQGSRAYHLTGSVRLEGKLSIHAFEKAIQALWERNEILRTTFRLDQEGALRQVIKPVTAFDQQLVYIPASGWTEEEVAAHIEQQAGLAFDLANGPLVRVGMLSIQEQQHIFYYTMHHIISDGWSMEVMRTNLLLYYGVFERGEALEMPELRIQYKDYAAWQRAQLASGVLASHRQYWLQQLQGELPVLDMPLDRPRTMRKPGDGAMVNAVMDAAIVKAFGGLCQQQGATLFMGLLALVNALLFNYTGQEDVIVGSPVAGRDHPELEDQIGFFVNTIALRSTFSANDSFTHLLQQVKQTTLAAYEHQQYPFDELIKSLSLQWDKLRNPLFEVMVVLQKASPGNSAAQQNAGGLQLSTFTRKGNADSKTDLVFDFTETMSGGLEIRLEYSSELYRRDTINRLVAHFQQLMAAILLAPGKALGAITYLTREEQAALLAFNHIMVPDTTNKTVITLFEEQAGKTPGHTALVDGQQIITYEALNQLANRFAHYLQATHHIKTGVLVGIQLDRGLEYVVAILAILKTGATYMPVDPSYPAARIAYMVQDSRCRLLIDEVFIAAHMPVAQQCSIDNPLPPARPDDLAYVIYTSGSTGMPKGVMVAHAALANLCHWHNRAFSITAGDRATLYAGVAFDAAVWELFPYLLQGAALYVVPPTIRLSIADLAAYYDQQAITVSFLPTQIAEQFLATDNSSLRYLLTGGDKLNAFTRKPYKVVNNYGPTEATVVATSGEVEAPSFNIPIGRPIDNTTVFILNQQGNLQPLGVVGEICIGGAGLASGYLYQPGLTRQKFVTNAITGERLYKTGDLGRWLTDGQIEFAGRIDEQVKIRGHRVETGEVEAVLKQYAAIEAAAVIAIAGKDNQQELVAYLVSREPLLATEIRSFLLKKIPAYMIPARFAVLSSLPLTANGKLDKKQLVASKAVVLETGTGYTAPRNETEARLAGIWEAVLDRQPIGVRDDFFELGGNSLRAAQVITRIQQVFKVQLTLQALFEEPTIERVAEQVGFLAGQESKRKDKGKMIQLDI